MIKKATLDTVKLAGKILNDGGVVIIPSTTSYVFATSAFSKEGIERIYKIKNRDSKKATGILVNPKDADKYAIIPFKVRKLIDLVWPAPLNIILKKKEAVPDFVTAGIPTIMVMDYPGFVSSYLCRNYDFPIAITSANISSQETIRFPEELIQFDKSVDLILDNGIIEYFDSGTIVSMIDDPPLLLRDGAFPWKLFQFIYDHLS
jgi:L-threonylcarbamoyladenylate synthase